MRRVRPPIRTTSTLPSRVRYRWLLIDLAEDDRNRAGLVAGRKTAHYGEAGVVRVAGPSAAHEAGLGGMNLS